MLIEQWRGTVVLFVCYILCGAVAGMVVGSFVRESDPRGANRIRKTLVLLVLLAFALNSGFALLLVPNKVALIAATVLIAACVLLDIGKVRKNRGIPPALVFGVLISSGWIFYSSRINDLPPVPRTAVFIGCIAVIFTAALLAHRFLEWCTTQYAWSGVFLRALKVPAVLLLAFGPSVFSSHAEGKQPILSKLRASDGHPNVVVVTLDTVSASHMGIYGYRRANTPHLEELLKTSTLYTNFIAASPLTLTSHASIFTGLYPQSHGAYMDFDHYTNGRPLVRNIPTLAQVLTGAGYRTLAVAANKIYLSEDFGVLRGFEFVDWQSPTTLVASERDYMLRNRLRSLLRIDSVRRDLDSIAMTADEVNERAFSLTDQCGQQHSPFLLFLNYMDAHEPYVPPAPYSRMYPGLDLGYDLVQYYLDANAVLNQERDLGSRARQHMVSQYDGAIAYLDQKIGELIAHLKQNGQYDQTLIIITSDHGEAFGEKRIVGHNSSVYQDQVHVPLIVKYPGQTQPERIDGLASHVDLMPTVLDVAGVPSPKGVEGTDLREAAGLRDRVVVAEMHGSAGNYLPRFNQIEWALYSGRYKIIYSTKGMRELYDLTADPDELHNLYGRDPQQIIELRTRLVDWSRRTPPHFLDAELASRAVEERLKSLGYAHQGVD